VEAAPAGHAAAADVVVDRAGVHSPRPMVRRAARHWPWKRQL